MGRCNSFIRCHALCAVMSMSVSIMMLRTPPYRESCDQDQVIIGISSSTRTYPLIELQKCFLCDTGTNELKYIPIEINIMYDSKKIQYYWSHNAILVQSSLQITQTGIWGVIHCILAITGTSGDEKGGAMR